MPDYEKFITAHKGSLHDNMKRGFWHDRNKTNAFQGGKTMQPEPEAALAEFYLAVALRLRPDAVESAGSDSKALLQIARDCAEEDFEPFVEQARELVSDYNPALHEKLEETSPFYEVDDGLFWHANFDVAAPAEFQHFLTALGHGSGQGHVQEQAHVNPKKVPKMVEEMWNGLNSDDPKFEPARRAAMLTYEKWLHASSMPVKSSISKVLMEHGLIIGEDVHDNKTLFPNESPNRQTTANAA
jgi:hypothetical protein